MMNAILPNLALVATLAAASALLDPAQSAPAERLAPAPQRSLGPGVLRGDVSTFRPAPSALDPAVGSRNSAWRRVQDALDRSTGYIVPEPLYQLDQIERDRRNAREPFDPTANRRRFFDERERWLRVDARQLARDRKAQGTANDARERERLMRLKEYQLLLDSGDLSSLVAQQAERDRMAIEDARNRRDQGVESAGDDAEKRERAERAYQDERARILGFESAAPVTTQPAENAVDECDAIDPPR